MSIDGNPPPAQDLPAAVRWARSPWPRFVLLTALLGGLGGVAVTNGVPAIGVITAWVARLGPAAPVVFVLFFAAASMAFFPVSVLAGLAGILFGPVLGVPLVWLSCMLGAFGAFRVGRGMSRQAVEQLAGARLSKTNARLDRHGAMTIALLRLLPVGPFAALNYLVAVTTLSTRSFLLGTGLGILPGVVIYPVLGGTVTTPTSPVFLATTLALALVIICGAVGARRFARATPTTTPSFAPATPAHPANSGGRPSPSPRPSEHNPM